MEYRIYRYTFPNGKIYIGMTRLTVQERKDCGYQHNIPLKNALKQYGWQSVRVDILETTDNRTEAFELEKQHIAMADSTNPDIGYNISKGGKSTYAGLKHTEEYKRRMSELYKGRSFSSETLSKMKKRIRKNKNLLYVLMRMETLSKFMKVVMLRQEKWMVIYQT